MQANPYFAKKGLAIGFIFIVSEFLLFDVAIIIMDMPFPKLSLYILFLLCLSLGIIIYSRKGFIQSVFSRKLNYTNLPKDITWGFLLYLTAMGSFILYNLIKANLYNEWEINAFINHNYYVKEAQNPFILIGNLLYSVFMVLIYQGFLLNGFAKYMGFTKSSWIIALFYGYWYGDIIGYTIICLFLNLIYRKTKNILYPMLVLIFVNLIFSGLYAFTTDTWILKAEQMNYYEEFLKGLVFTALLLFASIPVFNQLAIKKEQSGL